MTEDTYVIRGYRYYRTDANHFFALLAAHESVRRVWAELLRLGAQYHAEAATCQHPAELYDLLHYHRGGSMVKQGYSDMGVGGGMVYVLDDVPTTGVATPEAQRVRWAAGLLCFDLKCFADVAKHHRRKNVPADLVQLSGEERKSLS